MGILSKEDILKVFKLRKSGMSYNAVSKELNMSPAMSWHILKGSTYYDIKGSY